MSGRLRTGLALGAALAVIGLLLGLPAPKRPASALGTPSPSAPAGPTLKSVWPNAKPFPIQGIFADGSAYTPVVVLDPTASIGVTASADGQHTDLVVVPATGAPRVLASQSVTEGGSFDGISFTAEHLYWMHTLSDSEGRAHVTLWTAPRSGGPARPLSTDVGAPVFYGSQYDVQPVGDRLYWAAARAGHPDQTELRSIPLTGGPVTVKVIAGAWAMSKWPWVVTAPSASDQPTRLHDLTTGQVITVNAPANKQVACSPTWCRMIPDNAAQATETDLIRLDGSDLRVIGDASAAAIASDVAMEDRFEVLMSIVNSSGRVAVSKLTLYDILTKRSVLVDPAATNAGARGGFLWWSTGDNETLAWHGLDLRTLT
jgi:hypothetical protein